MTAEGTPPHPTSLMGRLLGRLTALIVAQPTTTIALALGAAAVALLLTVTTLGYRTSRLDLLDPDSDYNRLWIEYINEFGDEDDVVIVVEGAHRDQVVPVLQEISEQLAQDQHLFHAILHEVDLSRIRSKGLHYLPEADVHNLEQFIVGADTIARDHWERLALKSLIAGFTQRLADPHLPPTARQAALDDLGRLAAGLDAALAGRGAYQSPWPGMPASAATLSELSNQYLLMKEGRLGFVLLRLAKRQDEGFTAGSQAVDALRALIARARAKHPALQIGLTGLPIMENDEMRASQSSMLAASLVSMAGVALLFVAGFGGVRHALLANLVLLIGMAWSFGYVTLSVGHLNILSVSFTVTLIGIGIDYGVHYVARYLQLRGQRLSPQEALVRTASGVGPAILTGAVTTAVAFYCTGMTSFTGVAELGVIAGGGLLLCAAAELFVLPAAIVLVDRSSWGRRAPEPLPIESWIQPLLRTPRKVLLSTAAFSLVVGLGVGHLWYDHNLLNMQPIGIESVELERKLLTECNQSVWYALSIADSREELLARKQRFLQLPSVERIEEIASLIPTDDGSKQHIIARIQRRLAALPERPPVIPVDAPADLGQALAAAQQQLIRDRLDPPVAQRLAEVRDLLRRMPLAECYQRLSRFQQHMAGDLLSRLHLLGSMADPTPPSLDDLPAGLVTRFVGKHQGRHLLKIYGKGNIWDMQALTAFVRDIRSIDPRATGNPLQTYEASLDMKRSYEQAALYALAVIVVVLLVDFRNPLIALLAALPLGVGMLQLFGLMGLLGIPLNPANMIALPLILGIGVDYGVHILHDYREHPHRRYRMSPSTAVAVMVDSLTTVVGFGSLMIASHQGLQSLGRVLTIGVTCCLFTSMVMLPALLTWWSWNRPEREPDETAESLPRRDHAHSLHRRDPAHHHPGTGPHALPAPARQTDRATR